jgi:hypothetical protein
VAAQVRRVERDDHLVTGSDLDLVIAPGAAVALDGLIRLHVTHFVRAVVERVGHLCDLDRQPLRTVTRTP